MSKPQTCTLLNYLRDLAATGQSRDLTDRQLLDRFLSKDQAAFTSIIKRHGRLVWDVCRRTLGNEQDTEDAFQTVFMVLACKAGSIRRAESLCSWLHGVALRTAMNSKRKKTRQRMQEQRHSRSQSPTTHAAIEWQEVQALLDEEIERLPPAYRAVFVLCCMEGKSLADAARELDKTEAATAMALSRARKRLKERLLERGVALGSVLASVALTATQATAAIPAGLVSSTIRAAASVAAQRAVTSAVVSESVAALVKAMIKEMTHMSIKKLRIVVATLIVTGALGGGAAWFSVSAHGEKQPADEPPAPANASRDGNRGQGEKNIERIAWGKSVDGLQAGLEATKDGRTCRLGESVKFVVWVRNTSNKPAKLTYHPAWFYSSHPLVLSSDGKSIKTDVPPPPEPVKIAGYDRPPPVPDLKGPLFELTLDPAEEAELGSPELAFEPADSKGAGEKTTVRTAPTTCKVQYEGLSQSHPSLKTGQSEIWVQPAGAARVKEKEPLKGNALRLAGSSWQEEDGHKGPTFHADGTGLNPDGSKFEWRVEGDLLLARRPAEKGQPESWHKIPILFSRDAKEYRFVLGKKEYRRFRISAMTAKPDDKRTEEGRQFRRRWVPEEKENEGDAPVPSVKPAPSVERLEGAIRISPNVHVSKANAEFFHAEVVLAADPTDSGRLAAASMYSPPPVDSSAPKIIVYTSTDSGKSWAPALKRTDANPVSLADPAFAWGASDSLFFVNMWTPSLNKLEEAGCLQVVRSQDGGRTWGTTTTIKEYHDRPFLAIDNTGGKYQGRLYCLTHKGLLVSTDAGKSFGTLRSWPRQPEHTIGSGGTPLVLSDGTLLVLYNNDFKYPAKKRGLDHNKNRRYLAVRASQDGGDSFSEEHIVAEYIGAGYSQAAVAPAQSAWPDRVFVVWQETLANGHTCIRYAYSKDRGATFSKPIVLSEQSEEATKYDAFLPSIAVNKAGVVAVTWYDTRALRPGESGWDVRIRVCRDGGETWQPSVQVSDAPTRKDKKTGKRILGVGHTAGLAADADGHFHCLWVDGRTGFSQVFTVTVTVGSEKKP